MKPSITIDERGILLHVTNDAGEGVAVKLDGETITQLGTQLARAKASLMTPEGKKVVGKALASLFWQLAGEKKDDGTPEA